jgi:DNA-binding NarL/FixJ family response regulator
MLLSPEPSPVGVPVGVEAAGHAAGGVEPAPAGATRVLLVDDHRTFADLLAFSLDSEDDFTCVGRAGTVAEALALTDQLRPDIVVMDISLPDGDGLAATGEIIARHPRVRVILLTAFGDATLVRRAARAGASGFLVKDGGLPEVLSALRAAHDGILIVNSRLLSSMAAPEPQPRRGAPSLTARESKILDLLADGQDVRDIARTLSISLTTCRGQVKRLREKLGARTQLEAVVTAARLGLLSSLRSADGGMPYRSHSMAGTDEARHDA